MPFEPHWKREKPQPPAPPPRDRYDKLMLSNAIAGVVCAVVSSIIAVSALVVSLRSNAESGQATREALDRIAVLTRETTRQADAQGSQLGEMRLQSGALSEQAKSLAASVSVAKARAAEERGQYIASDRPSLSITLERIEDDADFSSLVLTISNDGPVVAAIESLTVAENIQAVVWREGPAGKSIALRDVSDAIYEADNDLAYKDLVEGKRGFVMLQDLVGAPRLSHCLLWQRFVVRPTEIVTKRCRMPREEAIEIVASLFPPYASLSVTLDYQGVRGGLWRSEYRFEAPLSHRGPWPAEPPVHKPRH